MFRVPGFIDGLNDAVLYLSPQHSHLLTAGICRILTAVI